MAKTYLNQRERTNLMLLLALTGKAEEIANEIQESRGYNDIVDSLNRGIMWLEKSHTMILDSLDERAIEKIRLEAARHTVAPIPKVDSKRHTEKMIQWDADQRKEVLETNPDYLHDLAEVTLALACRHCDGSPRNVCKVFRALSALSVEPVDENDPKCCYSLADVGSPELVSLVEEKILAR